MELSERKKQILKAVVEDYVATAEPVGSKAIAAEMGVSSATVRNELADLVELGYLEQPHTSAGRVPSPPTWPPPERATSASSALSCCGWSPRASSRC